MSTFEEHLQAHLREFAVGVESWAKVRLAHAQALGRRWMSAYLEQYFARTRQIKHRLEHHLLRRW